MVNLNHIFTNADFSAETDFKDRLRMRLFQDSRSSEEQKITQVFSVHNTRKNPFARELSLDELDLVAAAGDVHSQVKDSSIEDLLHPSNDPLNKKQ